MPADLLPPNATPLERAADAAAARISDVPVPLAELWDPATCAAELLPWLAWSLSVDLWDSSWPEETKRAAIAGSIALHRRKGTRASVEQVLARLDDLCEVVEWHQAEPERPPHTFDVVIPLVTPDGVAPGGERSRAAFVDTIIREIGRVKPLREHLRVVQQLALSGHIGLAIGAQASRFDRFDAAAAPDHDPLWLRLLQAETGEPLQGDDGDVLEHQP